MDVFVKEKDLHKKFLNTTNLIIVPQILSTVKWLLLNQLSQKDSYLNIFSV